MFKNFLLFSSSKFLTFPPFRPRQKLWNIFPTFDTRSISSRRCEIWLLHRCHLCYNARRKPAQYRRGTLQCYEILLVGTTEQNNGNADFIGHAFIVLWTSFLPHTHTLVCCVIVSRRKKVLCIGLFDLMSQRAPCVAVPWLTYMVTPDKLFWCHFLPLISFLLPSDVNTTNFYFSWPSSALIVFVLILNIVSLIGQVTLSENTSFKDHGIVIWDFVTLDNTSVKTNWDGEI